jgi:hypothetical protein
MMLRIASLLLVLCCSVDAAQARQAFASDCRWQSNGEQRCKFNAENFVLGGSIQLAVTENGRTITCQRGTRANGDDNTWYGDCDGDARDANFVVATDPVGNAKIFGSIQVGSNICQISSSFMGVNEILCAPESGYSPIGESIIAPSGGTVRNLHFGYTPIVPPKSMIRGSPRNRQLYDDSGSNIDILVVWTTAAECSTSNLPVPCLLTSTTRFNMLSVIKLAIAQTNTAFAESGIRTQLRLVHAYRDSTYVETPATRYVKELQHLRTVDDGKLDSVHEKRALYGADMVAMIAGTLSLFDVVPLRKSASNPISCRCAQV